ncbi:hypothetical protein FW778_22510 [Ginsengibacter hankyongi]|uniref:Uncharacterized protein n=1 Tax=Ginsengibacter hankyongi TaxID=2607284 RepID=A0A5J5IAL4_9BACT|nr:hypothetical protein [Ginsengibacter hankyongi]KAA9034455.1 hypothetical protein FW778_22510 [Ginsengibacter hankyongi]
MKSFRIPVLIIVFAIFSVRAYSYISDFIMPDDSIIIPSTYTINITGRASNKLILKNQSGDDASEFNAVDNDIIIWNNEDPDITILKIKQKFLRKNRFQKKPAFQLTAGGFEGQLENYNRKPRKQHYFIKWKDKSGKKHRYDPLIRINPNTFD